MSTTDEINNLIDSIQDNSIPDGTCISGTFSNISITGCNLSEDIKYTIPIPGLGDVDVTATILPSDIKNIINFKINELGFTLDPTPQVIPSTDVDNLEPIINYKNNTLTLQINYNSKIIFGANVNDAVGKYQVFETSWAVPYPDCKWVKAKCTHKTKVPPWGPKFCDKWSPPISTWECKWAKWEISDEVTMKLGPVPTIDIDVNASGIDGSIILNFDATTGKSELPENYTIVKTLELDVSSLFGSTPPPAKFYLYNLTPNKTNVNIDSIDVTGFDDNLEIFRIDALTIADVESMWSIAMQQIITEVFSPVDVIEVINTP